jgi:hypothetical protein
MKIVSENQLTYIKKEYAELVSRQTSNYIFEGDDKSIFENLVLFSDEILFDTIRTDHYLAMSNCNRVWNRYFWYLRYESDILKMGRKADNHQQPIFKVLEELDQTCGNFDHSFEPFINLASHFENQEYIIFDYLHPAITDTDISIKSKELSEIVELLEIPNFDSKEIDSLIKTNIDNSFGELLTFKNKTDKRTKLRIDTFSASEDQIHPIEILIQCKIERREEIDELLVASWTKFWKKMGPFVAISAIDKFNFEKHFLNRKLVEK